MKNRILFVLGLFLLLNACSAPEEKIKKRTLGDLEVLPFHPSLVTLNESPFMDIRDREFRRLLEINPKRYLSGFQQDKAMSDSASSWRIGYEVGSYLSACSRMYASTGDPRLSDRITYVVNGLEEAQNKANSGFLGYLPSWEAAFLNIASGGEIISDESLLNGMERPLYYTSSLMTGLIDAYIYGDNRRALHVVTEMTRWINGVFQDLSTDQMDKILRCDHGRISEVLSNVHILTGKNRYRFLAFKFQPSEIETFQQGDTILLNGKDQYAEISKVLGYAKLYELLASEQERDFAVKFWDQVTSHYTYPGGNFTGNGYFGNPDQYNQSLEKYAPQLASSVLMARLTHRLFCWKPEARYGDYIEKLLYNQFFPCFNTNQSSYSLPMTPSALPFEEPDSIQTFRNFEMGMMSFVDFSGAIFYEGKDQSLYLNLFVPSTLNYLKKKMQVTLETKFPSESRIVLRFEGAPKEFPVRVRYPQWAKHGVKAMIDGEAVEVDGTPGSFMTFKSKWGYGSSLEISFPMYVNSEILPGSSRKTALFYGPVILAGYLGADSAPLGDHAPVIVVNQKPLSTNFYPTAKDPLSFYPAGVISPENIRFMPAYQAPHQFYSIYWDVYTQDEYIPAP